MNTTRSLPFSLLLFTIVTVSTPIGYSEDWTQFKFDSRHSGNVPERNITTPLSLVDAIPLTDAIYTSPVIRNDNVYVLDGSGVLFCLDAKTLKLQWKYESPGGLENCNNVSSPVIADRYVHFGTMTGTYYVLDAETGDVIRTIECQDPIFSTPVVSGNRVYFATLGAQVYAVTEKGKLCWTWDFVREVLSFTGDRWDGQDWLEHSDGRVTWRDHFCCSRNISMYDKTLVIPAGGRTVFLKDDGAAPKLLAVGIIPSYHGSEYPATFGQSVGEDGKVYVQYHRRDNAGRVEILQLVNGEIETDFIESTRTEINLHGLLSFSSVSIRGDDVYRCRPEQGFGFCKHTIDSNKVQKLGGYPSISSPILTENHGIYGGLDGSLYVTPLSGNSEVWSFKTAFGKPISASVAVSEGRIYFGCEDGYLYVLGPNGKADSPTQDLQLWKIRHAVEEKHFSPKFNWFTNYGNMANRNAVDRDIQKPIEINWIRRVEGTVKHLPVSGGGRVYTHTAEGIIMASEQDTGRILWRRYWPNTYLSFTSPLYYEERLLLPQAGMDKSMVRCLDAATGELIWETPFTGSPSWSRQAPPAVYKNLVIYASGSGKYAAQGTDKAFIFSGKPEESPEGEEIMSWMYTHNNPYYPKDNKPLIWAWDLETGELVWKKDFSDIGRGGNDCGVCLMDGKLYYSTFFGYSSSQKKRRGLPSGPNGLTAELDPMTGNVIWKTTDYFVTAGCTLSGKDGRLYLGGYNPPNEETDLRHIWCLDAKDGSLIWQSDPVKSAVNVVSIGEKFIFSNAIRGDGHVIDKKTGKIVSRFNNNYNCTRFALSGSYLMGANMDIIDLLHDNRLISTGPAVDSRECLGSTVADGRIFYTSQASGLQVSLVYGNKAEELSAPWER